MSVISNLVNDAQDLPTREMLKRMNQRITSGEDESVLIIKALHALEHLEGRQLLDALELATRNRRKLSKYFDAAISRASDERNALRIDDLLELKNLIDDPPNTGKTLLQTTMDTALDYLASKKKNPRLTYRQHAKQTLISAGKEHDTESVVIESERIKTAISRVRKAMRKV